MIFMSCLICIVCTLIGGVLTSPTASASTVTVQISVGNPSPELVSQSQSSPWIPAKSLLDLTEDDDDIQALAMKEMQEMMNKKMILDLYREVFATGNLTTAYKYLDENTYIQHAPYVADGRDSFLAFFKAVVVPGVTTSEIYQIGADGDLVYVHGKNGGLSDGSINAVVDIYRVKNLKVVEHWDVTQNFKLYANTHPFF